MQVALITGGSKGFGRALAASLVGDGWTVVIDGRDEAVLNEAVESISEGIAEHGGRVVGIAGDVSDAGHRDSLRETIRSLGRLDLLVNNASTLGPSPQPTLADYPIAEFERVLRVNVVAPLTLIQSTLPLLREHRGTVIDQATSTGWRLTTTEEMPAGVPREIAQKTPPR